MYQQIFISYFKTEEANLVSHLRRCLICCFIVFLKNAREQASLFL